jgi:ribose 5-phosphate isomerase B
MFAIGSDHGGYELKKYIIEKLGEDNFKNYGTFSDAPCDYPDIAIPLAKDVAKGIVEKGILICKTGIGVDICANKVKGIRCGLCYNKKIAEYAKRHEDVNIIAIPAEYVTKEEAIDIIKIWTKAKFEGERHQRRIDKIKEFEER